MAACYEQQSPEMIIAPVIYHQKKSLLGLFQQIDFMTMQGITAATHKLKWGNMCNGANLAFTKEIYNEVNGYEGITHLATGDDYLLMTKIARLPNKKISYLKSRSAIMATAPQYDWMSFLQQRIRWASKSGKYEDKKITRILLLVYVFNFLLCVVFLGGFFMHSLWVAAAIALAAKTACEYLFLIPVSAFFRRSWVLIYFPFLQPLHILYIVVAGFLGFIGKYQWKNREVQ
ncbi:MAG: hypothetical protein EBX41_09435 [Chitinophagia bacterium]|nr:hypothetical protein [Chitinophagia bacterium]